MEKLHPKAVWIFFIKFFIVAFLLSIVLGFGAFASLFKGDIEGLFWWVVILIFFGSFTYMWAKFTYNAYKYELTEDAFRKEHGIILKKYVSIPYERIQNVDIHRGILARIFGLSDLMIQTAGYAARGGRYGMDHEPEGKLPGVSRERAEQLRDELIKRAKGAKSGV